MARYTGLDLPPSANRMWGRRNGGGYSLSPAYTAWKKAAGQLVMIARQAPVRGRFIASLRIQRGASRIDLDNFVKPTLDLMQYMGIIENDALCERVTITWADDADKLEVEVEPIEVVEAWP